MEPFGVSLTDQVYEGDVTIGKHSTIYASGTSIGRFPASSTNYLIFRDLNDQAEAFLANNNSSLDIKISRISNVPILGVLQVDADASSGSEAGRLAIYGDSSCLDSSHLKKGKKR